MCKEVKICGCANSVDLKCLYNTSEELTALGISKTEKGINIFKKINEAFADLASRVDSVISVDDLECPITNNTTQNVDTYVLTYDCTTESIKFIPARIVKLIE